MTKIIELMKKCEELNYHFAVSGFNYEHRPMGYKITVWVPQNEKDAIRALCKHGMEYSGNTESQYILTYEI